MKKVHVVTEFGDYEHHAFSSFAKANSFCLDNKEKFGFVKWYTTFNEKRLRREFVDAKGDCVLILSELEVK